MKRVPGVLIATLALVHLCGCLSSSTAPVADGTGNVGLMSTPTIKPGPFVFVAGVPDGFAAPAERSVPSPALRAFSAADWPQDVTRKFDEPGANRALIHTFTGWSFPVRGAVLELHLRADSDLSENDSVRLGLVGGSNTVLAFKWWMSIHTVTGSWEPGSETTLRLDLANLPAYASFPTNILSELQDHSLELLVEDDTAIDYARLTLTPDRPKAEPVTLAAR